ncbi:Patatin [Candidatus Filomicrobium marinum]|uniref:Patatin n=1 Tax=Candidatus Filomicrobium marinum TaxID=1608628 RepID=A0A0D6J9K6_9HYPH|nr:patatin-like phospholipase family protein [Candidatus Filomicrobium marinum]CFW99012.1 Patatin [Candidatus Filomicrobium marinum]CPR14989.1 Patatin [Candidatus Filomicrobium marinum]
MTTSLSSRDLTRAPRIGLALGGGGARGLAHILMLEVFDEMGLRPQLIAGTSIGAIFGAAYASGYTAAQIRTHTEEILKSRLEILRQAFSARQEPLQRFMNVFQLRSSIFNAEALLDLIMPPRTAADFASLEIPLKVIASEFSEQKQMVLSEGPLLQAVAASMALPGLFTPVEIDGAILLDGGLVNPLPFDVLAEDTDITIAINVTGAGRVASEGKPSAFETIVTSLQILQQSIVREKVRTRKPDILIDVEVGNFHVLEFHKLDKVLEAAAPAKARLRQQLERILFAEPADVSEPDPEPQPKLEEPEPARRARLAERLLGRR